MSDMLTAPVGCSSASATPTFDPVIRTVQGRVETPARRRLASLRAVILLDGTVRRTPFAEALDRSLLELPLDNSHVLLDRWRDEISSLRGQVVEGELPCRLVVGRSTRWPALRRQHEEARMSVEGDPSELRGTGGVLRDIAEDYDEADVLLVANAAQVLLEPLADLIGEAAARGGDVTIVANADGAPAPLALMSCRALRKLSPVGFVDLKEQGLPLIARHHEVTILRRARACALPIRTPADYLSAVRAHQRVLRGRTAQDEPFAERWHGEFALVEEGALVSSDAVLHDSVVLRGARVEAGALAAQSLVCSGAIIGRRESVVRQLVSAGARRTIDSETR